MERVFVDTSALLALGLRDDDRHKEARRIFEGVLDAGTPCWTSSYVLVEHISLLHRRAGTVPLRKFAEGILPLMTVVWVEPSIHEEALRRLLKSVGRGISFVDATSFLLLKAEPGSSVFAFDSDFEKEGFRVLR